MLVRVLFLTFVVAPKFLIAEEFMTGSLGNFQAAGNSYELRWQEYEENGLRCCRFIVRSAVGVDEYLLHPEDSTQSFQSPESSVIRLHDREYFVALWLSGVYFMKIEVYELTDLHFALRHKDYCFENCFIKTEDDAIHYLAAEGETALKMKTVPRTWRPSDSASLPKVRNPRLQALVEKN